MVQEDKTLLMAKCAIFEKEEGTIKLNRLKGSKAGYLYGSMAVSFVSFTVAFFTVVAVYHYYLDAKFFEHVRWDTFKNFSPRLYIVYVITLLIYGLLSNHIYRYRFVHDRKRLKNYYRLKRELRAQNIKKEARERDKTLAAQIEQRFEEMHIDDDDDFDDDIEHIGIKDESLNED